MKCPECGSLSKKVIRNIQLLDERAGPIEIGQAEFWECRNCGSRLYTADTASRISDGRQRRIEALVRRRPLDEFVSMVEAASLLGITRQAFHKNRRIKKGFVYGTDLGGRPIYLRSSVLKFKTTGDGRCTLWPFNPEDVERVAEDARELSYPEESVIAGQPPQRCRENQVIHTLISPEVAYV